MGGVYAWMESVMPLAPGSMTLLLRGVIIPLLEIILEHKHRSTTELHLRGKEALLSAADHRRW
jgi:hypothetical protein